MYFHYSRSAKIEFFYVRESYENLTAFGSAKHGSRNVAPPRKQQMDAKGAKGRERSQRTRKEAKGRESIKL